jgi:hypothetical protein
MTAPFFEFFSGPLQYHGTVSFPTDKKSTMGGRFALSPSTLYFAVTIAFMGLGSHQASSASYNEHMEPSFSLELNKTSWCNNFIVFNDCSETDWEGVLKDMFSPDDTCPQSLRYIDLATDGSDQLQVSASGTDANCNSTWGRKFNSTTSVNPVLAPTNQSCVRTTSFVSKVPPDDPLYEDAQNGALNFTLMLGTVDNHKVNMWNGVYNGQVCSQLQHTPTTKSNNLTTKSPQFNFHLPYYDLFIYAVQGGDMNGVYVPPSDCDNFWIYFRVV